MAVKRAASRVARLTPAAKRRIDGKGPEKTPNKIVRPKAVALRSAWRTRAINTGKDGEMRIAASEISRACVATVEVDDENTCLSNVIYCLSQRLKHGALIVRREPL